MSYPKTVSLSSTPALPTRCDQLGPDHPALFSVMAAATALRCLQAGALLSTRDLHSDPLHTILGYPGPVRRRLTTPLPSPFLGRIGDAVPLTWTPRTLASYGSVSVRTGSGATPVGVGDMVVAALALETLVASGLPLLFCDRSLTRTGATVSEAAALAKLPWDRIRRHQFSPSEGDPEAAERYEAEALVFGAVPVALVHALAVYDQGAADKLLTAAAAVRPPHPPVIIVPDWFHTGAGRR